MADREYPWDVALSFLWDDRDKAEKVFELLYPRGLEVFFAPKNQTDVVGTDGEQTFAEVFRDRSRVSVVFYRPGWGATTMTRAEESGIRQKGAAEGYGFCLWVPLDGSRPPAYVPPRWIWADWELLGAEGLAATVIARVQESGTQVRAETTADKLKGLLLKRQLRERREAFPTSKEGVEWSRAEAKRVLGIAQAVVDGAKDVDPQLPLGISKSLKAPGLYFQAQGPTQMCEIEILYHRIGEGVCIRITHKNSDPHKQQWYGGGTPAEYLPSLDNSGEPAWLTARGKFSSTESLICNSVEHVVIATAEWMSKA